VGWRLSPQTYNLFSPFLPLYEEANAPLHLYKGSRNEIRRKKFLGISRVRPFISEYELVSDQFQIDTISIAYLFEGGLQAVLNVY
jgi:hypothetical protein